LFVLRHRRIGETRTAVVFFRRRRYGNCSSIGKRLKEIFSGIHGRNNSESGDAKLA